MKKRNDGRVRKEYIRPTTRSRCSSRTRRRRCGADKRGGETVQKTNEKNSKGEKKKKRDIFSFWYSRMGAKGGKIEPRRLGGGKKNCNGGTKIC